MNRGLYEGPIRPDASRVDRDFLIVTKTASIKDRILLSPIFKYVVPVIAVVAILVTAVYLTLYFVLKNEPDEWLATCNVKSSYRVECFPGRTNITYDRCQDAGCCWSDETQFCFHSVPARHGYTQRNTDNYQENEVLVPRRTLSPAGSRNAESLILEHRNVDASHVEIILRIGETISRTGRAAVGRSVRRRDKRDVDQKIDDFLRITPDDLARKTVNIQHDEKSQMNVHVGMPEFSVTVTRKNETTPLLSTARGPLILTETYWEFTLFVTNGSLYGLNQLELNGTTSWIYDDENGSVTPSFLGIDDDGRGTACYVNHDGPMEIQVLDGSNLVVVRGVSLPSEISLHVFAGPTPIEAVSQLTKARRNNAPPNNIAASALGLHICPNDNATDFIDSLSKVVDIMKASEAPWDSHCLHQGFKPTLGNPLSATQIQNIAAATGLLKGERSIVPHLSPMLFTANHNPLALQLANSYLLLRDPSNSYIYEGSYRNQTVRYPDWCNPETGVESRGNLTDYLGNFGSSSLVYLRDSWPRDDRTKGHPAPDGRNFSYMPAGLRTPMTNGTVPYNLRTSPSADYHYIGHNKYAREFSDFANVGNWTSLTIRGLRSEGGDSSWAALRAAISVGVGSCLVGQLPPPMYVCGTGENFDAGDKKDELCSRWYGSAVMWPHVLALPENLPGSGYLTESSSSYAVKHLTLRASLVTYARTILARHYIEGAPILAPTSVHYPKDLRARRRSNQYFWGDAILVGLVTLPRVTQVLMWLPGEHPWRHLKGGLQVYPSDTNDTSVPAVRGQIVMLIRPGFVIPVHEEIAMTSEATAKRDLTLVANWMCTVDCAASGKIFYGTSNNDDIFLDISISQMHSNVELNNVLKVKERACVSDTTSARQTTVIKSVEILGGDVYDVNIDLCKLTEDSSTINLTT